MRLTVNKPAEAVAVHLRRIVIDLDADTASVGFSNGDSEHVPLTPELRQAALALVEQRFGPLDKTPEHVDDEPAEARARREAALHAPELVAAREAEAEAAVATGKDAPP